MGVFRSVGTDDLHVVANQNIFSDVATESADAAAIDLANVTTDYVPSVSTDCDVVAFAGLNRVGSADLQCQGRQALILAVRKGKNCRVPECNVVAGTQRDRVIVLSADHDVVATERRNRILSTNLNSDGLDTQRKLSGIQRDATMITNHDIVRATLARVDSVTTDAGDHDVRSIRCGDRVISTGSRM